MSSRRLFGSIAIAALLAAPVATSAREAAVRIYDRTILCTMVGQGSPDTVRFMIGSAAPFQPADGVTARAGVGNDDGSIGSSVGAHLRTGPLGTYERTGFAAITRTTKTRCVPAKQRISLASRGLRGGTAELMGTSYRCDVPAQVLIRLRAVFKRPVAFSVDPRARSQMIARADLVTGTIAVATARGLKPILLTSANGSTGKAQIFAAPSSCGSL